MITLFSNTYKIADHVVRINSLHNDVHQLCSDYLSSENPEFEISVSQYDINSEREKNKLERFREKLAPFDFSDGQLETTAVYRKLCEKLIDFDIILMHGSVVAVDGEAYLFTAKSGTGKSTHTRLWTEYFGERAFIVNDDKPLIMLRNGTATVYGTAWDGKHHISRNTSVKLKSVCILERSENNHISRNEMSEIYPILLQQIYKPKDTLKMLRILELTDRLNECVSFFTLGCNMETDAVITAYNGMKGER